MFLFFPFILTAEKEDLIKLLMTFASGANVHLSTGDAGNM